jgi:hypothetical protein
MNVPNKKSPLGKKLIAAKIVASEPMTVISLAVMPRVIRPRQIGVINLVTGARNDPCSIVPIVGLGLVSTLIFPLIDPDARISIIGQGATDFAKYLGIKPSPMELADAAIFVVSAVSGATAEDQMNWELARELYIPSIVAITDLTASEVDFDDMAAIAGKMLDPVITPFLVLHDDEGKPTALINLDSLVLINYSNSNRIVMESDPEHKVLVFEFRKEYLEALEEFGPDSFNLALTFPAIPIVQEIDLGKYELLEYLAKLPSRS